MPHNMGHKTISDVGPQYNKKTYIVGINISYIRNEGLGTSLTSQYN
jgi:hypothetical protein